ncbi:MAG: hypothetical protein EOP04_02065 [Proteobacteria bacterium]|nr:MAG: hypothetical protein EOP04_02065 [Pseudomonadota bacterium]
MIVTLNRTETSTEHATTITLRGTIDQNFNWNNFQSKVKPQVVVDLKDVDQINSSGVRAWIKTFDLAFQNHPVEFRHVSTTVIDNVNIFPALIKGAKLKSFNMQYFCECGFRGTVLFTIERARQLQNEKSNFELPCECGQTMEPDVGLDNYLKFLIFAK